MKPVTRITTDITTSPARQDHATPIEAWIFINDGVVYGAKRRKPQPEFNDLLLPNQNLKSPNQTKLIFGDLRLDKERSLTSWSDWLYEVKPYRPTRGQSLRCRLSFIIKILLPPNVSNNRGGYCLFSNQKRFKRNGCEAIEEHPAISFKTSM